MFLRCLFWFLLGVSLVKSPAAITFDGFSKLADNADNMNTTLKKMPLEIKVGQLFLAPVYSSGSGKLPKKTRVFLEKTHLGNVIYFRWANKLDSFAKVKKLSAEISTCIQQNTKGLKPLIAVDQEGGRVAHLQGSGFTFLPSHRELAVVGNLEGINLESINLENIQTLAKKTAQEMLSVGVNLNLAPVVDVDSNSENPVINSRSFSKDPGKVVACAKAFITGLHEGGVLATLKHFPGHGDVTVDSHLGLPVVTKTQAELDQVELYPFVQLASQSDLVMVAHLKVNALDPEKIATFSPCILQSLLREELGFKGVIISDSLVMRGAAPKQATFEEALKSVSHATIKAFLAGCDLLILSSLEWADFKTNPEKDMELIARVMEAFKKAVEKGAVSEKRLDASLERILKLKNKLKN